VRIAPRERRHIGLAFLMGAVWSIAAVGVPYVAGAAVNALHRGRGVGGVAVLCCVIVGLALGKAFALRVRRYLLSITSARVAGTLRERLYRSLHARDGAFFDRTPVAEVFSALGDDAEYVEQFGIYLQVLFNNVVWTGLIVAVLVWLDPLLAAISLAPLPLVLVLALRFLKVSAAANEAMREDTVQIVDLASDAITGVAVVKGLGLEQRFVDRLIAAAEQARVNAVRTARVRAKYTALIELVPTFSVVIVLLLGLDQVRHQELTLGGLTAFISYIVMAVWPLRFTANSIAGATRARLAITRIARLEGPASLAASAGPDSAVPDSAPLAIDLEGVSFAYQGHSVLRDVDLHVRAGEVVAVTGATGSGKTTLLQLIGGELEPDAGTVSIGGASLDAVAPSHRAALLSTVTHDEFLFSRTVRENLAFARPHAGAEELEEAAELAVFDEVIDELSDGWETVVGERATRLSGGQRQRAALARGIASAAGVLLLDDVTSALDAQTRAAVAASLRRIRARRTVVLVTSEPTMLAAADRIIRISERTLGEVVSGATE
jgi:ATP-binding cassette subfamily B protein